MDEDFVLREIVKNLAFEIEAVNQENVLKWSTTNGTPLNVKVRVRNKDEPRLLQRGTVPVPRIGISAPEKLALVSSNQTILSFSVYLQDEVENKEEHKRHSAFKIFNIGNCLRTYSDDEGPYLPSSSNQNAAVASDNSIISSTGILKKRESQVLITSNTVHRNKKRFFGKCKPGGCLDPPFGEEKYTYGLSKTDHHENIQVELNDIEDNKQTSKPGGCLDSPFSEDKHSYSLPKTDHQEIKQKLSETSDISTESRKKTPERSREHEIFIQITTKDEGDPNKLTDIDTRTSEETSLKLKYSNSIITYPTDIPSKERVFEKIPTDSLRQSYENPESYFVPPKDVKRYKEDERRHVKRLSMDQLSRSSKVAANDMTDKSKIFKTVSKESKYVPQNTKGSKDTVKDKTNLTELQQNDIEIASKISVNKYETATLTQLPSHVITTSENIDILRASENRLTKNEISNLKLQRQIISTIGIRKSDINKSENLQYDINIAEMQLEQDIPSTQSTSRETISKFSPQESNKNQTEDFQYDVDVVQLLAKQEIPSTRYTAKEAMSALSPKNTYKNKTENHEDSINTAKMKIKEDKPLTRSFSGEAMSTLSSSIALYSSHTRILDSQNAQNQEKVDVEKQPMPALERFVNADIQTTTNFNQEKNYCNKTDDGMLHYKKTKVTNAVIRNLTTVVTEKQSLQSKDKPNVLTNSLLREKVTVSLGNPEGRNVSPNYISSTENIEFDISSSHSMDFKNELSSPGKTNNLLDSPKQKDNWLSAASNSIKEKDDLIDVNLTSEPEQRKASAILQKKTFVTKQDSNIHNDDISKATPLKRNTFTIIGSDISLQKSEEVEEMPEDLPDAHLKINDKTKSGSPGNTRGNNDILDNINKKSEDKIHANFGTSTIKIFKEDNLKDMSSKIIGYTTPIFAEQANIKGESLDRKKSGNIFISDVDKCLKQKNLSDQTNYQTEIAEGVEPARIFQSLQIESLDTKDQAEYTRSKDISGHQKITDGEIIPTTIIDRKSVLDGAISNKIELLEEYSELRLDSLQKSIPKNEQKVHKTMYVAKAASTTRNYDKLEGVGIKDNENSIFNNGQSVIETLQKPTTKNEKEIFSEIIEDDNLVAIKPTSDEEDHLDTNLTNIKNKIYGTSDIGSTQNLISGNEIQSRDLHSIMTGKIRDKTELKDQINIKPDSENTKQESVQKFYAQLAGDNKDFPSDQLFDKNTVLDKGNIEPTHKFISENTKDLHSVMTGKIHDKTELKDQIYIELDSAKLKNKAVSNIFIRNELENVQDLHAQTIEDIKEFLFDKTNDKNAFLDRENKESTQKSLSEHVRDLHLEVTNQIHSNTELKDQIWLDLYNKDVLSKQIFDKGVFLDTENKEPTQKSVSEHVRDLLLEVTNQIHSNTELKDQIWLDLDNKDVLSEQIFDKGVFLDTENKEPTQKSVSEHVRDLLLEVTNQIHSNTELKDQIWLDLDNKDVLSEQIFDEGVFLDTKNKEPTQKFIPEHLKDLHLGIIDQIPDKTEVKSKIYNELDNLKHSDAAKDDSVKMKLENVKEFHEFVTFDQTAKNRAFLDTQCIQPIQKHESEHDQDLQSGMIDKIYDKMELKDQIYTKMDNAKYMTSTVEFSQKAKRENTQNLYASFADDKKAVSSDQDLDTEHNEPSQEFIAEHIRDLHSEMTDEIREITEVKSQIHDGHASLKYSDSDKDDSLKNQLENVHDFHARTAYSNEVVTTDQNDKYSAFLDIQSINPTQKFIPEHIRDLHSEMTDEIREITEVKSQIHDGHASLKYSDSDKDDSLKNQLENVHDFYARTAYSNEVVTTDQNDKYSAFLDIQSINPTQKFIPEHDRDLYPAVSDKSKTELNDRTYKLKYSESAKDKLLEITSETAQDLHAHTTGHIKYVPFGLKYEKSTFLNTEHNEQPLNVLLEHNRDLHSAIIDKAELNDQQYNKLDKFIYNELATDDLLNDAQTADQNEYLISDQKHNKKAFVYPDSNKTQNETEKSNIVDHDVSNTKYHEQIELAQNFIENNHDFKEKSRSASKTSLPFSGYSGLISEVLSNITENTEGEEKQLTRIKVAEGNGNRLEDFAVSDTKAYRDDEMIDNEWAKNVGKSGLLAHPSENIDSSYKIEDGSCKVPQNSLAKSYTSTLEESDGNMHNKTIAKAFHSIQIAHSSDKLRQLSDDYQTNKLNIVREDLYNATDITNQKSEFQASKKFASINDTVELNDDDFAITHNVEPTLVEQNEKKSVERHSQLHSTVNEPKISGAETSRLQKDTIYLDMSFYSYINDNYQRVVQTHSPQIEQYRPHGGTVTVVKTLIRHGNEIRIPVDKENDISLNILDKDVRISNKGGTIGSPLRHTREKPVFDLAKRHDDVINKNLALIYEHELIPLHNVIKDLAQEVNTLSTQQERLQVRIRNTKRRKSLRLIPVVKRCGCRRN